MTLDIGTPAARRKNRYSQQLSLPEVAPMRRVPPTTRYQGSKLKLLDWIAENLKPLTFTSALDAFGGTASVSYLLKSLGSEVTYNDYLRFNQLIGSALIENYEVRLTSSDIDFTISKHAGIDYDDFISRTFGGIYFTDEENAWLDIVCQNIPRLFGPYKRALAYYALFQACIAKRPYNLFHRRNLYMRIADVERGFGNKATWDKPFEDHFRAFCNIANSAVFDTGKRCHAICEDALTINSKYDLVYIDTPYINGRGTGVDYQDFYHFLEGVVEYTEWHNRVDYGRKHLPLRRKRSPWSDPRTVRTAFERLFEQHADSILVVSYRSDGIPAESELVRMLNKVKRCVDVAHFGEYKYVLSTNSSSREVLLIGT